jgi:hypothetical protein
MSGNFFVLFKNDKFMYDGILNFNRVNITFERGAMYTVPVHPLSSKEIKYLSNNFVTQYSLLFSRLNTK